MRYKVYYCDRPKNEKSKYFWTREKAEKYAETLQDRGESEIFILQWRRRCQLWIGVKHIVDGDVKLDITLK